MTSSSAVTTVFACTDLVTHILSFAHPAVTLLPVNDDNRTRQARQQAPELFSPRPQSGCVRLLQTCRLLCAMQPYVMKHLVPVDHIHPHGFFYHIDITHPNEWLLGVQEEGLPEIVPGMWDHTRTAHLERHDMRLIMWQWKEGVCQWQFESTSLPNIVRQLKWPCDGPLSSPRDACMLGWVPLSPETDAEFIDKAMFDEGVEARHQRRQYCPLRGGVW